MPQCKTYLSWHWPAHGQSPILLVPWQKKHLLQWPDVTWMNWVWVYNTILQYGKPSPVGISSDTNVQPICIHYNNKNQRLIVILISIDWHWHTNRTKLNLHACITLTACWIHWPCWLCRAAPPRPWWRTEEYPRGQDETIHPTQSNCI
jgi:hypothetical protein